MTSSQPALDPNFFGISAAPLASNWSASDLVIVLGNASNLLDKDQKRLALHARHRLSLFWLASPADLLETLYASDLGEAQRLCGKNQHLEENLLADELLWRQQLQALLQVSVGHPTFLNYWLALMPYLKVGELRLDQPQNVLPSWLIEDYWCLCEPEKVVVQPFPLASKRGESAIRWLHEEAVLARAVVLLNGFQLDAKNLAQSKELADLRSVIAQVWLDAGPEQVQALFETPIGLLTRSLVSCGFNSVKMNERERAQSNSLQHQIQKSPLERIPQQLLAALLYEPELKLSCSEADLPEWFQEELRSMLA